MESLISLIVIIWLEKKQQQQEIIQEQIGEAIDEHWHEGIYDFRLSRYLINIY